MASRARAPACSTFCDLQCLSFSDRMTASSWSRLGSKEAGSAAETSLSNMAGTCSSNIRSSSLRGVFSSAVLALLGKPTGKRRIRNSGTHENKKPAVVADSL